MGRNGSYHWTSCPWVCTETHCLLLGTLSPYPQWLFTSPDCGSMNSWGCTCDPLGSYIFSTPACTPQKKPPKKQQMWRARSWYGKTKNDTSTKKSTILWLKDMKCTMNLTITVKTVQFRSLGLFSLMCVRSLFVSCSCTSENISHGHMGISQLLFNFFVKGSHGCASACD